jgi:hypothetical protein
LATKNSYWSWTKTQNIYGQKYSRKAAVYTVHIMLQKSITIVVYMIHKLCTQRLCRLAWWTGDGAPKEEHFSQKCLSFSWFGHQSSSIKTGNHENVSMPKWDTCYVVMIMVSRVCMHITMTTLRRCSNGYDMTKSLGYH